MSDVTKCLVELRGMDVSVNVLTDRDGVVAINPLSSFFTLGTVREMEVDGARPGTRKMVWRWESEGENGHAASRKAAVAAMLADAGYAQVPLEATIPPLFEVDA